MDLKNGLRRKKKSYKSAFLVIQTSKYKSLEKKEFVISKEFNCSEY